jgi:hypothetical protein
VLSVKVTVNSSAGKWIMDGVDGQDVGPQLRAALKRLVDEAIEGLRHGYFELRVTCETGSGGKRHMTIQAGKSHKFTIPIIEIPA